MQYIDFKDNDRSFTLKGKITKPDPKPGNCYYAMGMNHGDCFNGNNHYDTVRPPLATWQKIVIGAASVLGLAVAAAPSAVVAGSACLAAIIGCTMRRTGPGNRRSSRLQHSTRRSRNSLETQLQQLPARHTGTARRWNDKVHRGDRTG